MTTELQVAELPELPEHWVYDGQRYMKVHGWHLASADTQQGTSVRWTELSLYLLAKSGRYVLEKVGRSDVYHSGFCNQNSKGIRFDSLEDAKSAESDDNREFEPCNRCDPGPDPKPAFVERDIFTASIYNTAEEMIESMFKPGSDNMKFLTRVGRELLSKAATNDETIAQLLRTPIDVD